MCTFGGFEIAQITGAMIEASKKGMIVMVDGFIATAAYVIASSLTPTLSNHCIFCHRSKEQAHRNVLEQLQQRAVLDLDLCLGEGTGCVVAYPIIKSSVAFLNEMASFEEAGVSNRE